MTPEVLPPDEVVVDEASRIDPSGRLLHHRGRLLRGIFAERSDFFRTFLAAPEVAGLLERRALVETAIREDLAVEGYGLVLEHRPVPFRSFATEWCPGMLRDAALLTLEVARAAARAGAALQDASPHNVLFDGPRPVFVDVGSFAPATEDYLWAPYEQYCRSFLFPLYLHRHRLHDVARLALREPGGVAALTLARVLGPWQKLRLPGYLARVAAPRLVERLARRTRDRPWMDRMSRSLGARVDLPRLRDRFFRSLAADTAGVALPEPESHWRRYYDETDDEALGHKLARVERVLEALAPATVIDLGANTGAFARLAARAGARTVACDSDLGCVERIYREVRSSGEDVLPLRLDVLEPTPAAGHRARAFPAAPARLAAEGGLALALVHHLVFQGGQSLPGAVAALADFASRWLLVEHVDASDPQAQRLPRRPGIDHGSYTLDNLAAALAGAYRRVRQVEALGPTRILLIAEERIER